MGVLWRRGPRVSAPHLVQDSVLDGVRNVKRRGRRRDGR
jgi:hypothetical protein